MNSKMLILLLLLGVFGTGAEGGRLPEDERLADFDERYMGVISTH